MASPVRRLSPLSRAARTSAPPWPMLSAVSSQPSRWFHCASGLRSTISRLAIVTAPATPAPPPARAAVAPAGSPAGTAQRLIADRPRTASPAAGAPRPVGDAAGDRRGERPQVEGPHHQPDVASALPGRRQRQQDRGEADRCAVDERERDNQGSSSPAGRRWRAGCTARAYCRRWRARVGVRAGGAGLAAVRASGGGRVAGSPARSTRLPGGPVPARSARHPPRQPHLSQDRSWMSRCIRPGVTNGTSTASLARLRVITARSGHQLDRKP